MKRTVHNHFAVALLLFAAVASYADLPRLSLLARTDALQAARQSDHATRQALAQRLSHALSQGDMDRAQELQHDVEETRHSLKITLGTPELQPAYCPTLQPTRDAPADQPPAIAACATPRSLVAPDAMPADAQAPPDPRPDTIVHAATPVRGPPARF
jgi:hypothetical protein